VDGERGIHGARCTVNTVNGGWWTVDVDGGWWMVDGGRWTVNTVDAGRLNSIAVVVLGEHCTLTSKR